jgi:glycosyltransferase involved in cell wall biosynthesis
MNIAIDISPLKSGHYLQHRVRGTGFYIENLRLSLEKYYPENKYTYFNRGDLLDRNINVVHYPYFEPFFLTVPLLSKHKTIVTVHDLTPLAFPEHFKSGLRGALKWQIQKAALRNAATIITDSRSSKKDIIKYTGIKDSKVHVIYLAAGEEFKRINDTRFAVRREGLMIKEIRKKYRLPEKFVLYVGDVTWNKNLPRLIRAIKKINVPLVMVGNALVQTDVDTNNPWNKDFNKVLKLIDRDRNIMRLGFVSKEELVILYNIATVFTMPSLYEGFGLPLLEAMSCECPVVTSRYGSIPEIAKDACRYVDAYDEDSIAAGISEVFNSKNLQQELSKKGLIQSKKFTWEKTARETMNAYKGVIDLK